MIYSSNVESRNVISHKYLFHSSVSIVLSCMYLINDDNKYLPNITYELYHVGFYFIYLFYYFLFFLDFLSELL